MISTYELNKRQKDMALCRLKVYFEGLPIEILSLDTEHPIYNVETYRETEGFFFKRTVERSRTVVSYKMLFKHNGQKYNIYINEDMMANDESLLNSLKFQLGIR